MQSSTARFCIAALLVAGSLSALVAAGQNAPQPKITYESLHPDVSKLELSPADYAWIQFILIDWPELANHRGQADPQKRIGQHGATVWESFKNVSETYRANGKQPAPWEVDDELPIGKTFLASKEALAALGAVDSPWVHFLAEPDMIDNQQICDASGNVLFYDVRGNRDYFDYVAHNPAGYQLFNMEGQIAAAKDASFTFSFPPQTIEIKSSWRILKPADDASRYWTAYGVYYDEENKIQVARIGLTGLHITSKLRPNWIWMTFEQVDNYKATFKYFLQEKGKPVGKNPSFNPAFSPVNEKWQSRLRALDPANKWQYYFAIDVQTDFVDQAGKPLLMSNTQMETYFQDRSSCISCHKLSSIGTGMNKRLLLFYPHNAYIGNIDFQAIANQQFPGQSFKDMDFAWSLRKAQWLNPPSPAAVAPSASSAGSTGR